MAGIFKSSRSREMRPKAESAARQHERVTHWNRRYPIGTPVTVERDNGIKQTTKTRSEAWMLSGHTAVVMVEGISGGYMLSRVRVILQ